MKNDITELVFILDRSGSMQGLERDTIGGFNGMLEKQRREPGICRITTVLFDDRYELIHDRLPIDCVRPMDDRTYYVRGCTALLDAVGRTIERIVRAQRAERPGERADHVMFVIITDGYENASRHFDRRDVHRMIGLERERYGWEFIFLGANIDAESAAEELGIARERAVNYCPDARGTQMNFEAVSKAASCIRNAAPLGSAWWEDLDADYEARKGEDR